MSNSKPPVVLVLPSNSGYSLNDTFKAENTCHTVICFIQLIKQNTVLSLKTPADLICMCCLPRQNWIELPAYNQIIFIGNASEERYQTENGP